MLKGILSISGQPGLYKMVAEAKNKIIVESLVTGKRMPASASAKISSLEDIAVYTHSGDVPLREILKRIYDHENGEPGLDPKATNPEVKKYFEAIVPDYDQERVYVSDIRKVLLWYNLLQQKEMLDFTEEPEEEVTDGAPDKISVQTKAEAKAEAPEEGGISE